MPVPMPTTTSTAQTAHNDSAQDAGAQSAAGAQQAQTAQQQQRTAEEQQEADRLYEERMEDEYAKREGGA
jgi:hypothetical protein